MTEASRRQKTNSLASQKLEKNFRRMTWPHSARKLVVDIQFSLIMLSVSSPIAAMWKILVSITINISTKE